SQSFVPYLYSPPFPTRRSSDLFVMTAMAIGAITAALAIGSAEIDHAAARGLSGEPGKTASSFTVLIESKPLVILALTLALFHLRSEEHTSELQSRFDLVCRLLL